MNKFNAISGLVIVLVGSFAIGCGLHTDGTGDKKDDGNVATPTSDAGAATDTDAGTASGCNSGCTPAPTADAATPATDAAPATDGGSGTVPTTPTANIECVPEGNGVRLNISGNVNGSLIEGKLTAPPASLRCGYEHGEWTPSKMTVRADYTNVNAPFSMFVPLQMNNFNCVVFDTAGKYYWFNLNPVKDPTIDQSYFTATGKCQVVGTVVRVTY